VRTVDGDDSRQEDDVEQWLFNDAPRLLRVQAIEKIPELLEALLKNAAEMSNRISERAEEVDALTAAMSSVVDPQNAPTSVTPSQGLSASLAEQFLRTYPAIKNLAGAKARK